VKLLQLGWALGLELPFYFSFFAWVFWQDDWGFCMAVAYYFNGTAFA